MSLLIINIIKNTVYRVIVAHVIFTLACIRHADAFVLKEI